MLRVAVPTSVIHELQAFQSKSHAVHHHLVILTSAVVIVTVPKATVGEHTDIECLIDVNLQPTIKIPAKEHNKSPFNGWLLTRSL